MSKKVLINGVGVLVGALIIIFALQVSSKEKGSSEAQVGADEVEEATVSVAVADSVEVVHFHGAQQCWSCITVGEYALKTIMEKFPEEYANGTVVFKEINGELPENKDMVLKYRARGSSLFVNGIINGDDNIEEEVRVWMLVSNENKFKEYFEERLNTLLGR